MSAQIHAGRECLKGSGMTHIEYQIRDKFPGVWGLGDMGAAPLLRSEFWARRGSWADFLLHPPSSLPYTLYSGGRAQCHCFPAPQDQQAGWGPRCLEGSLSSPATLRKASSSSPLRIPPRPALSCPHKQLYSFAASNLHYVMHGSFNMYQANLKMVLKYLGFRTGR